MDKRGKVIKITDYLKEKTKKYRKEFRKKFAEKLKEIQKNG
jgi:predicted DNA-binding antitoxin AbrB/MazE fold protein